MCIRDSYSIVGEGKEEFGEGRRTREEGERREEGEEEKDREGCFPLHISHIVTNYSRYNNVHILTD